MAQYLVAIHHPDDFDPSAESESTIEDIHALNREMVAASVRVFVGGLAPAPRAKSLRAQPDGKSAHHRRAVSGNQGAHRRFLGARSRRPRRGTGLGTQGCPRLSCAGRGARGLSKTGDAINYSKIRKGTRFVRDIMPRTAFVRNEARP